ncbi:hypothetical protein WDL1CHR_06135 [Variovorax sp. WDL1]|nr:hypothetical protein APY03_5729 [Variovorax sp. WDL1]PNG52224.1 hypothetical protein CHC07_04595 [Variovorax sp. B4]PNG54764.1 hypothetical protein CHC06_03561 [Variovorax sp. B2]VTV15760.1 hypothetical protein WDL1CHR_06135 [Variovorax sp. WDL1]
MKKKPNKLLLRELRTIAQGLGKTLASFAKWWCTTSAI